MRVELVCSPATWALAALVLIGCGSSPATPGTGGASGGSGGAGESRDAGAGGAAAGLGGRGAGGASGIAGASGVGGGVAGTAGGAGGATGAGGAPARACKRGIATNTAPGAAVGPAVTWWYNWSLQRPAATSAIEFVPMIWGSSTLGGTLPAGTRFLLGFNEPNFHAQSNLTAQQAAAAWPTLQAKANAIGASTVSPALNFCGPAASCNGTDPYQYLTDFFAACVGCDVDYLAVHWYNCDLPSLRDYLEPGGNLAGFEQFGRPIWLTEFSCNGTATVAQQEAFMRLAVPYLENNPRVCSATPGSAPIRSPAPSC